MRKTILSLLLCLGFSLGTLAQTPRDITKEAIPVAMFQVTYAFHLPAMETKARFGVSNTIGGSFVYKTEGNWLLTANGNFIFGKKVKGDRIDIFGEGITTSFGEITGGGGTYATFSINQRGMHLQAEAGKLFPFGPNPNSGWFVQAGAGYLTNRIHIEYDNNAYNTPYVVEDDYEYGYDRMRGGPALHLETGYLLLSDSRLLNLSVSLELTYARTKDLRDYDFRVFYPRDEAGNIIGEMAPVGYTDPHQRYNDLYYGIRVSWNIPTYQRQPEKYYYN
mgnify:FL=1